MSSYSFTFNVNGREMLNNGGSFTFTVNLNASSASSEQASNFTVVENANTPLLSPARSIIHVCCNDGDDDDDNDSVDEVILLPRENNDNHVDKDGEQQRGGSDLNNDKHLKDIENDGESQTSNDDADYFCDDNTPIIRYSALVSMIRESTIKYSSKKVSGGGECSTRPNNEGDVVGAEVEDDNSASLELMDDSYDPAVPNTLDVIDYNESRGFT